MALRLRFKKHAKDLILKLLVQEPSERLGVRSFDDLRRHSFLRLLSRTGDRMGSNDKRHIAAEIPQDLLNKLDEPL